MNSQRSLEAWQQGRVSKPNQVHQRFLNRGPSDPELTCYLIVPLSRKCLLHPYILLQIDNKKQLRYLCFKIIFQYFSFLSFIFDNLNSLGFLS